MVIFVVIKLFQHINPDHWVVIRPWAGQHAHNRTKYVDQMSGSIK